MKCKIHTKYIDDSLTLSEREDNQIMDNYRDLSFVKDNRDEEGLHMYYSPYKVPTNLTKLQVRRAINKYFKSGSKIQFNVLNVNRLSILFNGELILGADVTLERPKDDKEMKKLIKTLLQVISAPRTPIKSEKF